MPTDLAPRVRCVWTRDQSPRKMLELCLVRARKCDEYRKASMISFQPHWSAPETEYLADLLPKNV